jgi:hypothetical protein
LDRKKIIANRYDLTAVYFSNHGTLYGPHFLDSPSKCLSAKKDMKNGKKGRKF